MYRGYKADKGLYTLSVSNCIGDIKYESILHARISTYLCMDKLNVQSHLIHHTTYNIFLLDKYKYISVAPDFFPMIQQTPTGGIVSGNNVTLTCSVEGGNPLANLYWNCTGYMSNNTAVSTAKYTVEFTVNKNQNEEICECSAKHPVASYTPVVYHRLDVYCKYYMSC